MSLLIDPIRILKLRSTDGIADVEITKKNGAEVEQYQFIWGPGNQQVPIPDLSPGQYQIKLSPRGCLVVKRLLDVDAKGDALFSRDVALLYGDLDGDNFVSESELTFVRGLVGRCSRRTLSWAHMHSNGLRGKNADLDGDGAITDSDVEMMRPNVGLHGD
ncbi:MAG: hypothetical protein EOP06_01680 [Proteobacteria bacterium]|nr:MAG: hypothetical protein EOP06_01680 [Pseudomonadota bacterium]